jgi:hypothetical protein
VTVRTSGPGSGSLSLFGGGDTVIYSRLGSIVFGSSGPVTAQRTGRWVLIAPAVSPLIPIPGPAGDQPVHHSSFEVRSDDSSHYGTSDGGYLSPAGLSPSPAAS